MSNSSIGMGAQDKAEREKFENELKRILYASDENGVTLRVIGSLAFQMHCPKYGYLQAAMGRAYTDIDFAGYRKEASPVKELMKNLGYEEQKEVFIMSEGDRSILDLLKNIDNYQNVKGIAYREGNKIVRTESPQPFEMDDLEFHPYHLFPMGIYRKQMNKSINITISRGCPYNCNFCSLTMPGVRMRSIHHIEAELEKLVQDLEGEHSSLDQALALFERGQALAKRCGELLEQAELKIQQLTEDGTLEDFEG